MDDIQKHLRWCDAIATLGIGQGRTLLLDLEGLAHHVYEPEYKDSVRYLVQKALHFVDVLVNVAHIHLWIVSAPELESIGTNNDASLKLLRNAIVTLFQSEIDHPSVTFSRYASINDEAFSSDKMHHVPIAALSTTADRDPITSIHLWLRQELPVILLEGSNFATPRLFAWLVDFFTLPTSEDTSPAVTAAVSDEFSSEQQTALLSAFEQQIKDTSADDEERYCVALCLAAFQANGEGSPFPHSVALAALALAQTLPLRSRNLAGPTPEAWDALAQASPELAQCRDFWLKSLTALAFLLQATRQSAHKPKRVEDIVDGRLYRALCLALLANPAAPASALTASAPSWLTQYLASSAPLQAAWTTAPKAAVPAAKTEQESAQAAARAEQAASAAIPEPLPLLHATAAFAERSADNSRILDLWMNRAMTRAQLAGEDQVWSALAQNQSAPTLDMQAQTTPAWPVPNSFTPKVADQDSDRFAYVNQIQIGRRHEERIMRAAGIYRAARREATASTGDEREAALRRMRDATMTLFGLLPVSIDERFRRCKPLELDPAMETELEYFFDSRGRHKGDMKGIQKAMEKEQRARQTLSEQRLKTAEGLIGGPVQTTLIELDANDDRLPQLEALNTFRRRLEADDNPISKGLEQLQRATVPTQLKVSLDQVQARQLERVKVEVNRAHSRQRHRVLRAIATSMNQQQVRNYKTWLQRMDDAADKANLLALVADIGLFIGSHDRPEAPLELDQPPLRISVEEREAAATIGQTLSLLRKAESYQSRKFPSEFAHALELLTKQVESLRSLLAAYGFTNDQPPQVLARFVLRVMGPHFRRPSGREDYRSEHFPPDDWQRTLLTAIDNRHSALISAPTSSGKTFISFYAIEQVLRAYPEHGDGRVVYLAPTRTLMQQVRGDVEARFEKKMDRSVLLGELDPGFRFNLDTCQVLVASPECLEELLLDPVVGLQWRASLKWVIFDEIHSITSATGRVWERLLALINCPFLALSATLGNVDHLRRWLNELEDSRRRPEVTFIEHKKRWNDLGFSTYAGSLEDPKVEPMNPIALYRTEQLQRDDWKSLVKLIPEHLDSVLETLREIPEAAEDVAELTKFRDTNFGRAELPVMFGSSNDEGVSATPSAVEQFEAQVKGAVQRLAQTTPSACKTLLARLAFAPPVLIDSLPREAEELRQLYRYLNKERQLPALIFRLNVSHIQRLGSEIVKQIELSVPSDQELKRETIFTSPFEQLKTELTNDEHKRARIKSEQGLDDWGYNEWAAQEAEQRVLSNLRASQRVDDLIRATRTYRRVRDQKHQAMLMDDAQRQSKKDEMDWNDTQYDEHALEQAEASAIVTVRAQAFRNVGFCVPGQSLPTMEELHDMYAPGKELAKFENMVSESPFFQALLCGVGMHYSALSAPKRRLVENLFRAHRLAVVLATETLAVGISMPCPTVVITGDAPELDPTNFQQMSGRAGRRGFDLRGQVILFNMSSYKARFCLSQSINTNAGNPVGDAGLTLKMLCGLRTVNTRLDERSDVLSTMDRVLCQPMAFAAQDPATLARHHRSNALLQRFVLEFLARVGAVKLNVSQASSASDAAAVSKESAIPAAAGKPDSDDEDDEDLLDDWDASSDEEGESVAPAGAGAGPAAVQLTATADLHNLSAFAGQLYFESPLNFAVLQLLVEGTYVQAYGAYRAHQKMQKAKADFLTFVLHCVCIRRENGSWLQEAQKTRDQRQAPVAIVLPPAPAPYGPALAAARAAGVQALTSVVKAHKDVFVDTDSMPLPLLKSTSHAAKAIPTNLLADVTVPTTVRTANSSLVGKGDVLASASDALAATQEYLPWLHSDLLVDDLVSDQDRSVFGASWKNACVLDQWQVRDPALVMELDRVTRDDLYDHFVVLRTYLRVLGRTMWARLEDGTDPEHLQARNFLVDLILSLELDVHNCLATL